MKKGLLIKLRDIPPEGMNLDIEDQSIWMEPIREFELPYDIVDKCRAKVNIQKNDNCCVVKGHLTGKIVTCCDRCLEDAFIEIDDFFHILEEPKTEDSWDISFIVEEMGEFYLNLAGLLWERFMLNIPQKILCSIECKGLCPHCGSNLNLHTCNCDNMNEDPRLTILKKIKIY